MINYLTSILSSRNSNSQTYRWLVCIALIYATVAISNKSNAKFIKNEGFHQTKPYVYKKDDDIYDEFYADIYDELMNTSARSEWELVQMIRITSPDTNNSVFLDIGSGTGLLLFLLQDVIGIDKSYGFDINEKSIKIAKLVNPYKHIKFNNSNKMNNILKDINIVTMIDVLHHVPQKEKIPFLLNILNQIPRGSQIIIKDLDPLPRWMAIANRITDYFSTNSKVSYISSNEI